MFVNTDGEYTINGNQLTLNTLPAIDTKVVVTHFSKHDVQAIERTNFDIIQRTSVNVGSSDDLEYKQLRNGLIKLRKEAYDQYSEDDKKAVVITTDIELLVICFK